jgi:hypothetical protein
MIAQGVHLARRRALGWGGERRRRRRGWGVRARDLVVGVACLVSLWSGHAPCGDAPRYVDMHVHVGCLGFHASGCFVAEELRRSPKFRFYLRALGVTEEELRAKGDRLVIERLSARIAASETIRLAVVLALDGVIDADGELDRGRTQVYVPNEYLARELPAFGNLRFGASINPYRRDAIERLEWAKREGAVLVKWIPAIMDIDPADERIIPFYDKLVELDLPLLTHAGQERAFSFANDLLGDPRRLALPLARGVTVIAAHIATTGRNEGEENFERILPMFREHPKLYADISSLTQINKLGYLRRALEEEGLVGRLLYGSDWPLQFFPLVSPWYQLRELRMREIRAIQAIENPWDRDVALKRAMGVPEEVFARSALLLGL